MANEQNLIPFGERTESEQREIRTAGGVASGEARRKKKAMREWAEIIGGLPAKVVCPDGSLLPDADLDADTIMKQYHAAHGGSTKAAKFLADLKGELRTKVDANIDALVKVVRSEEERQKIENIGEIGA